MYRQQHFPVREYVCYNFIPSNQILWINGNDKKTHTDTLVSIKSPEKHKHNPTTFVWIYKKPSTNNYKNPEKRKRYPTTIR